VSLLEEPDTFRCLACVCTRHQLDFVPPMPRPCISARSWQIAAPITVRNFHSTKVSHRLVAECIATTACISWNKDATHARCPACCPLMGNSPCHQSIIGYVKPTAHPPNPRMKRQTTHILINDSYSLWLIGSMTLNLNH
jgi:hypothetical protein